MKSKLELLKERENKINALQKRVEELQKAGAEKDTSFSVVNLSFLGWEGGFGFLEGGLIWGVTLDIIEICFPTL